MGDDLSWATSAEIARAVASGKSSALNVVDDALARIEARNPALNAFTAVIADRARTKARALDAAPDKAKLPLAGVPFAVKNLFDIAGLPTVAGSRINRARTPASKDSPLIERLEAAGAVLVGALNMGEYAYDFTGENIHDGPSRNPHDLDRMTGGSSGGSGGAVAGGMVPLALGSDTNGSIRVPSSLCGIFGLKPTYGRLVARALISVRGEPRSSRALRTLDPRSRAQLRRHAGLRCRGSRPASSARSSRQRRLRWNAGSTACASRWRAAISSRARSPRRSKRSPASPRPLAQRMKSKFPQAARARAAAYVITATEGAALHLDRLRKQASDFDPAVRDRLIAGAMVPSTFVVKAQNFRRWYRERVLELFESLRRDPGARHALHRAKIGQQTFMLDGVELPVRPNMGLYTQPISFIGLPVVAVPVPLSPLPIAVQIITAPWREDVALRIAHALEQSGAAAAPRPKL